MKAILTKKLYTMAGAPLEGGMILIEDGKITAVGKDLPIPAGAEVLDFSTCEVTPGFIDAHTHIAGFGIQTTGDGNDFANPICPQMRLEDGVDATHFSFARTRLGGFTSICQLPGSGNLMGGCGYVQKLTDGADLRKKIYGPVQVKMALGENPRRCYGQDKGRGPMTRMGNAAMLREALREAYEYYTAQRDGEPKPYDDRWEALIPLFAGEAVAHVHCHRGDDILTAIRLLEPYGVKFSIDHCTEGHLVRDILAEKKISCVVGPIGCGPQKQETWHCTPACAALLEEAGVEDICLTIDGDCHVCALPLDAGTCMAYGLSEEAALASLTRSPAKVLGIADRVGTIEVGKDADIAVFDGFPLSNYTLCKGVFIDGTYYEAKEAY